MKNVFTSLTAALLVVWYSLSIIGFDVHTCSSSGHTYIATVASGFECEDIHDGHVHDDCCCHSDKPEKNQADQKFEEGQCCSDQYHSIVLTGVRGDDDADGYHRMNISCGHELPSCNIGSDKLQHGHRTNLRLLDERIVFRDVQSSFNIWRI